MEILEGLVEAIIFKSEYRKEKVLFCIIYRKFVEEINHINSI